MAEKQEIIDGVEESKSGKSEVDDEEINLSDLKIDTFKENINTIIDDDKDIDLLLNNYDNYIKLQKLINITDDKDEDEGIDTIKTKYKEYYNYNYNYEKSLFDIIYSQIIDIKPNVNKLTTEIDKIYNDSTINETNITSDVINNISIINVRITNYSIDITINNFDNINNFIKKYIKTDASYTFNDFQNISDKINSIKQETSNLITNLNKYKEAKDVATAAAAGAPVDSAAGAPPADAGDAAAGAGAPVDDAAGAPPAGAPPADAGDAAAAAAAGAASAAATDVATSAKKIIDEITSFNKSVESLEKLKESINKKLKEISNIIVDYLYENIKNLYEKYKGDYEILELMDKLLAKSTNLASYFDLKKQEIVIKITQNNNYIDFYTNLNNILNLINGVGIGDDYNDDKNAFIDLLKTNYIIFKDEIKDLWIAINSIFKKSTLLIDDLDELKKYLTNDVDECKKLFTNFIDVIESNNLYKSLPDDSKKNLIKYCLKIINNLYQNKELINIIEKITKDISYTEITNYNNTQKTKREKEHILFSNMRRTDENIYDFNHIIYQIYNYIYSQKDVKNIKVLNTSDFKDDIIEIIRIIFEHCKFKTDNTKKINIDQVITDLNDLKKTTETKKIMSQKGDNYVELYTHINNIFVQLDDCFNNFDYNIFIQHLINLIENINKNIKPDDAGTGVGVGVGAGAGVGVGAGAGAGIVDEYKDFIQYQNRNFIYNNILDFKASDKFGEDDILAYYNGVIDLIKADETTKQVIKFNEIKDEYNKAETKKKINDLKKKYIIQKLYDIIIIQITNEYNIMNIFNDVSDKIKLFTGKSNIILHEKTGIAEFINKIMTQIFKDKDDTKTEHDATDTAVLESIKTEITTIYEKIKAKDKEFNSDEKSIEDKAKLIIEIVELQEKITDNSTPYDKNDEITHIITNVAEIVASVNEKMANENKIISKFKTVFDEKLKSTEDLLNETLELLKDIKKRSTPSRKENSQEVDKLEAEIELLTEKMQFLTSSYTEFIDEIKKTPSKEITKEIEDKSKEIEEKLEAIQKSLAAISGASSSESSNDKFIVINEQEYVKSELQFMLYYIGYITFIFTFITMIVGGVNNVYNKVTILAYFFSIAMYFGIIWLYSKYIEINNLKIRDWINIALLSITLSSIISSYYFSGINKYFSYEFNKNDNNSLDPDKVYGYNRSYDVVFRNCIILLIIIILSLIFVKLGYFSKIVFCSNISLNESYLWKFGKFFIALVVIYVITLINFSFYEYNQTKNNFKAVLFFGFLLSIIYTILGYISLWCLTGKTTA